MINKLISQYIDKLTINDIKDFSIKQGIILNDSEYNTIYNYILNDWYELIYGNSTKIFNSLKGKINNESLTKIELLFNEYKTKYNSYL